MKHVIAIPKGICAKEIEFDIDDNNKIMNLSINGGCSGYRKAIEKIINNMDCIDVMNMLESVDCNNKGFSCPSRLSDSIRYVIDENYRNMIDNSENNIFEFINIIE